MKYLKWLIPFLLITLVVWADIGTPNGRLLLPETTTPTAIPDHGQIYAQSDDRLYYQDGAGEEHLMHPITTWKSFNFVSRATATGIQYLAGFYTSSANDADLDEGSPTVTHGGVNAPYAAHAFIVSGGNGTTNGSTLVLTVSGTSITDAGVRNDGPDTEVIESTALSSAQDLYFETEKKWIGQVTFTLTSDGGVFDYVFNYGFAKYEDFGNKNFTLNDIEAVGLADADDAAFNVELLKHSASGWTYAATGFLPGNTPLYSMNTIHSTEQDIDNGEPFAFKRSGLSDAINGGDSEGVIIRVTTGSVKAVSYLNVHVGVEIDV